MIDEAMDRLLADAHPLLLVSDPDGILQDEAVLAGLAARGRLVLREPDPAALRHAVERRAQGPEGPALVVVTGDDLSRLPYDLWQQGQHITLALHELFPHLDYPTLAALHADQRRQLAQGYGLRRPARPLSPDETRDYLLRHVFDVALERLNRPAALLLWLDGYHRQPEPMPAALQEHLLSYLRQVPACADWPLRELLADAETYRAFVREAWQREVAHMLGEESVGYQALPFGRDEDLQDALPRLVRTGTVVPLAVDSAAALPVWARPAVAVDAQGVRSRQLDAAVADLQQQLAAPELRWEQWEAIAGRWAQLTLWRHDYDVNLTAAQRNSLAALESLLDQRFIAWLQGHYSALALQVLPRPHHLFHANEFLAHAGRQTRRIALLVLDGMALADWLLIRQAWTARHPAWSVREHLLLSQVPCITAVARQALVSGRRPERFAATLAGSQHEARWWRAFWEGKLGSQDGIGYELLADRRGAVFPAAVDSRYTRALCLVSPVIDDMVHGATQGAGDVVASLKLWLQDGYRTGTGSSWFEGLIERLLANGFLVAVATDHGHVEATGMGQPQEGVTVATRGQRARLYDNLDFARTVQAQFPETILWQDDGLLPASWAALLPAGRRAFAPAGARVVSHGGTTIDEMIVPLAVVEEAGTTAR